MDLLLSRFGEVFFSLPLLSDRPLVQSPPRFGDAEPACELAPPRLTEGDPRFTEGEPRLSLPRFTEGEPRLSSRPPRLTDGEPRFFLTDGDRRGRRDRDRRRDRDLLPPRLGESDPKSSRRRASDMSPPLPPLPPPLLGGLSRRGRLGLSRRGRSSRDGLPPMTKVVRLGASSSRAAGLLDLLSNVPSSISRIFTERSPGGLRAVPMISSKALMSSLKLSLRATRATVSFPLMRSSRANLLQNLSTASVCDASKPAGSPAPNPKSARPANPPEASAAAAPAVPAVGCPSP